MQKQNELSDPKSCFNKAGDKEIMFILLSRDPAAPMTIRRWVNARIDMGKNVESDSQIQEALSCAIAMEQQRELLKAQKGE
jgi:hypothetical protein